MRLDAAVDVLRTTTIWRNEGLSPSEAYRALLSASPPKPHYAVIGATPNFIPSWADVQAIAMALRESLPDHEPHGPPAGNVIPFPEVDGSRAQKRQLKQLGRMARSETSGGPV